METLGQVNNREILYLCTKNTKNWDEQLPVNNWVALIVGDDRDIDRIADIAEKCLEKNVCYVCAIGQQCELIHDIFDELIVKREIAKRGNINSPDDFENSAMTTWHNEFEEGFWFATSAAFHEYTEIKEVICLDMTEEGKRQDLFDLTVKLKT